MRFPFALLLAGFIAFLAQPAAGRIETITRRLTSSEFNGRAFKSEGGRKAAEYLAAQFRESGLGRVELLPLPGGGQNVAGWIEGARKKEAVLIAAHYDAFGGPFVGARDSAAAVAVLVEAARLASAGPAPTRSLLFLALDGEEQGQAGWKSALAQPPLKPAAVLKLHNFGGGMGEKQPGTLYVSGAEFSPQLREAAGRLRNDDAHLALLGADVMRWPGNDHGQFPAGATPWLSITNGVHYSFHSRHDTPQRIDFPSLSRHAATLARLLREIANAPGPIERQTAPAYDAEESVEWQRILTTLREQVLKIPENNAGQAQIDDALLELKRAQNRPVQDPRAREAVLLRAANISFFMANPTGVDYNALESRARNAAPAEARQAWQRLLTFAEEEYRRDDRTLADIRGHIR